MATAYSNVQSDYGSPYYIYTLDVTAPTSRTGNAVTFNYEFWAKLRDSDAWDGDGNIWYDIGGKVGADTTDWKYWYSCGNTDFRTGTWSGNGWHGPWKGSVTVSGLSNETSKIRIRLWVNRTRGNAGKIDRRSYELSIPQKTSYEVSYNANGGDSSSIPEDQKKWYGDTLILSLTVPTRDSEEVKGYTVSYNANGGICNTISDNAIDTYEYSFSSWNTSSSGSGTSYNAGSVYTTNASLSLYAIWNETRINGSVVLPIPTRSGHTFLGWAESTSVTSTTYPGGSLYTPSSSITLYAVWRVNLNGSYVLKATSNSDTWETLIKNQNKSNSTLYNVGGQYNGWSIDNSNYVVCYGNRIRYNGNFVLKTAKPIRGGNYFYYQ